MSKRRRPPKARNGKRAYLRRFASNIISMGSAKRRDGSTTVAKEEAGFYNAARSLQKNPWIDVVFPGVLKLSPERRAALAKSADVGKFQELWQSVFQTGISPTNFVTYPSSASRVLRLFFSGQQWMFVEHDFQLSIIRRSIIYRTSDRAKLRFETNSIVWVEPSYPMPRENST